MEHTLVKPNPFALPGSEILKTMGIPSGDVPKKDILTASGGGGRARKPAPAAQEDPREELIPDALPPKPSEKPPVQLANANWGARESEFGEVVKAGVDIVLPDSHSHLTRVTFTLFRLDAHGKKERISSADFHAQDGHVEGEFRLEEPKGWKSESPVRHVFVAKHRDSEEIESPELEVLPPVRKLVCEFDDHSELKKSGHTLVLREAGGREHGRLGFEDGKEEGGIASFEFTGLDAETGYILEIQDGKGRVIEVIFSDMKHTDWKRK
jgi:hypothetical protein